MATASPSFQWEPPSEETENFFRLVSLLLDCGTDVLRKLLVTNQSFTHHSDLDNFLKSHEPTLKDLLQKRILSSNQYGLLFPQNAGADINTFDITLLSCLLINICLLRNKDKIDIQSLRDKRNNLSGHSPNAAISKANFQSYWNQITTLLTDLAQCCQDATFVSSIKDRIKDIETNPQFIQLTGSVLKKWFNDDRELLIKIDQFQANVEGQFTEVTRRIKDRISDVKQTVNECTEDIKQTVESVISPLKTEVVAVKTELSPLKTELIAVKTELSPLKTEIEAVKTELSPVKTEIAAVKTELSPLKTEIAAVKTDLQKLSYDIESEMEQKQSQTDTRLRTLIDRTSFIVEGTVDYIYTELFREAKKKLAEFGCLLVSGLPGEGKSTLCLVLMGEVTAAGRFVKLVSPNDWSNVNPKHIDTVFIDDIFGEYRYDETKRLAWEPVLEELCYLVKSKEMQCIISSRAEVLADCNCILSKYDILQNKVELSSKCLTKEEKLSILRSLLTQSRPNIENEDVIKCVDNYDANIGFPYCCKLFSSDSQLFSYGFEFFKRPYKVFTDNIRQIEKEKLVALIFLFCRGGSITSNTIHQQEELLPRIRKIICIETPSTTYQLRSYLETLCGIYLIKKQIDRGNFRYEFTHHLIYETIGLIYAEYSQDEVINTCNAEFLCQYVQTDKAIMAGIFNVDKENHLKLAFRFIDELMTESNVDIFLSRAFQDREFVNVFWKSLVKKTPIENVLKSQRFQTRQNIRGSNIKGREVVHGYVLSYLSRSKVRATELVMKKCLDAMHCRHTFLFRTRTCWKCVQKQEALNIALTQGESWCVNLLLQATLHPESSLPTNFKSELLEGAYARGDSKFLDLILAQLGISVAENCLLHAVSSSKENSVQHCIEQLKRTGQWIPDGGVTELALELAYTEGNLDIVDSLINGCVLVTKKCLYNRKCIDDSWYQNGYHKLNVSKCCRHCADASLSADHYHQVGAVCSRSVKAVEHCILQLKCRRLWNSNSPEIVDALAQAYEYSDLDVIKVLEDEEVPVSNQCLRNAFISAGYIGESEHRNEKVLEHCIHQLKYAQLWDSSDETVVHMLEQAYQIGYLSVIGVVEDAGVPVTLQCLKVCADSKQVLEHCVEQLKQTGRWDPEDPIAKDKLECACSSSRMSARMGLVNILIDSGVRITPSCVREATCPEWFGRVTNDPEMVKKLIEELKQSNSWDPQDIDAVWSLENAYSECNLPVIQVLESAGVQATYRCLTNITLDRAGTLCKSNLPDQESESISHAEAVEHCIKQLGKCDLWDPKNNICVSILREEYKGGNSHEVNILENYGVIVPCDVLYHLVDNCNYSLLEHCIQQLQSRNIWDPMSSEAVRALNHAYKMDNEDNTDRDIMKNIKRILEGAGVARKSSCVTM